jgi:hypothetical protein
LENDARADLLPLEIKSAERRPFCSIAALFPAKTAGGKQRR